MKLTFSAEPPTRDPRPPTGLNAQSIARSVPIARSTARNDNVPAIIAASQEVRLKPDTTT